jgi:hypothetical protein
MEFTRWIERSKAFRTAMALMLLRAVVAVVVS